MDVATPRWLPRIFLFAVSEFEKMTHSVARRLSYVVAYEKYGTAERAAKAKGTTTRTIQRWVTRFAETGTVSDAPRSGRPRVKQIHSSRGRKKQPA